MKRNAFALRIKKAKENEFRRRLGECWEGIVSFLDDAKLSNFSLWTAEDLAFGYCESPDDEGPADEVKARMKELTGAFDDLVDWISRPGEGMRLMYHNFGIVRENKELIRHRMFMTKLKPGCEEEYKRRHDRLVEQRGDNIDPGPDSNFSIWSAGGYIFGYNEIDTTMETVETEEEHQGTIAWETRQLEIMDWITNDCDWLTHEIHAASRRIAWHR